jgi:hypothetical protein
MKNIREKDSDCMNFEIHPIEGEEDRLLKQRLIDDMSRKFGMYKIKENESLPGICERLGVNIEDVCNYTDINKNDDIVASMYLNLHVRNVDVLERNERIKTDANGILPP